jgi:hypothetical protein
LNQPGKPPVPLSIEQVVDLLTKQGQQINLYERRIAELENINRNLQKELLQKHVSAKEGTNSSQSNNLISGSAFIPIPIQKPKSVMPPSKSEPLFKLDPSMM